MAELQFREALRAALREEMLRDERVFIMGEEVAEYNGAYKVTEGLLAEFGEKRIIDTPISELGFAGVGVGAAMAGLRPVVEFMTWNFALLAIDAIVNSAAKMRQMSAGQFGAPMVFRGATGNAGQLAQQHSQNFENWYANTPGLKVVVPSTPRTAKGLLKASIRDENPIIFMESELMYGMKGQVPDDADYILPIGKAEIVRPGNEVTIVTFGKMLHTVMDAVKQLEAQGIDAEVIDLLTVRPMDYDTIVASIRKTNRLVVVEEAWPLGSLSSEITYHVQRHAFDYMDAPVIRVTNRDTPLPYAPTLIEECLPNPARIIEAVRQVLYRN
ncbi:MAG: pyruvate dehydrogenase complex E1 component subunit beta [Bacteroidetes bacterium]|nr:pyruvate dehydrogenase complex E1 component subunit beta [Bacteroidota bacterium]